METVPAIVNITTLKGRLIARKFSTGSAEGVVKSVENKTSVAGQFAVNYRSETYCWTQELNREDYGVDKYLSIHNDFNPQ